MIFRKFLIAIVSILLVYSCAEYKIDKSDKRANKKYYNSSGFALIYNDNLYEKKILKRKINNSDLATMHNFLKPNTLIKIVNPENGVSIDTKISKKTSFPKIFNIVISEEIASVLKLSKENPYVEIMELKKNKKFVAKKGKIFDEEKNVANKAPVNEISMDDITKDQNSSKKNLKKTNFILVISDFYYLNSANDLKNELEKETQLTNISIKKINVNKYRLYAGPFKNFNALKNTYISLNNLGFEELNIFKVK